MAGINGKLKLLEQRAKSLENEYDGLLERSLELEKRSRQCEAKYKVEKTSFDLVEILMKQDGRSKAMFDHVSLFFYVLLTKLHRKGIEINSTTELWSRLHEQEVMVAYESTIANLGFTQKEINALNIILDVLHEKDLTVYVNKNKVDSSNLTQKLHDLNEEFCIDERNKGRSRSTADKTSCTSGVKTESSSNDSHCEGETVNEDGSSYVYKRDIGVDDGTDGVDLIGQAADITDFQHRETCHPESKRRVPVSEAECGDTASVDSLLLYLQIQRELDPIVTSALRRAVAVAHCSLVKSPRVEADDSVVNGHHACEDDEVRTKDHQPKSESKDDDTDNTSDIQSYHRDMKWQPALHLTEEIKASIPEGCGTLFFSDVITSTPEDRDGNDGS